MCGQSYDDPSMHDSPTCEGTTLEYRVRDGGWGMEPVPCSVTKGLLVFQDYSGTTRHACRWHRAQVERRYGVMEPQPEWLVTA